MSPNPAMTCRAGCAACCIAPSISTAIAHPDGGPPAPKPAGAACLQLDAALRCRLFGRPERPAVCVSLRPSPEMCGDSPAEALRWLADLERLTGGDPQRSKGVAADPHPPKNG
jgi:hypothetical protein